jgi:hypothetical protein
MSDQPRHLTGIDLFFESVHITLIAAGCYAGWLIGGGFFPLLIGGAVARVVWVIGMTAFRSRFGDERYAG